MERDERSGLAELAGAVVRARVGGLVDVFLERRAEASWRLSGGRVIACEALFCEGAAVRRDGMLVTADGLDRPVLAGLLGITSRALPPFSLPRFPDPPPLDDTETPFPVDWAGVRWRWSRAVVLSGRAAVPVVRPDLAEITFLDGRRALTCWPPAADSNGQAVPPAAGRRTAPAGKVRALLAPDASAVLLHELFGHPLEGDRLLLGSSPWRGRVGQVVLGLGLSITDDPTRADLPGGFSADDEGVSAAPRSLLADGVLAGVLADRRTSGPLGASPGNARRAGVHAHPRPRISNLVASATAPLPDPPRHDATIEILAASSGTLEPASGAILVHVRTAFALRGGVRRQSLAPFTLCGTVPEVAGGLIAAARPAAAVAEPGWCAKDGDVVATGAVAPWLLIDGMEAR